MRKLTGLSSLFAMAGALFTGKPGPWTGECPSTSTRRLIDRQFFHAMVRQKCRPCVKTFSLPSKLGLYKKAGR